MKTKKQILIGPVLNVIKTEYSSFEWLWCLLHKNYFLIFSKKIQYDISVHTCDLYTALELSSPVDALQLVFKGSTKQTTQV